jgi:glycosyltransferase involved in cell wall biosynthesis
MYAREQADRQMAAPGRSKVDPRPGNEMSMVSVCVCTRNRPGELRRVLESVRASDTPVHQVIVSDDGDDDRVLDFVAEYWPELKYVKGPRQGLGANRNRALEFVTGTHVLFLDDDAELARDFLTVISQHLQGLETGELQRAIVTGAEIKAGRYITPHEQGWLGFQNRRYKPGESLRTVVINATLFPRQLFDRVRFDPLLMYGYDEVDLTTQAVALGFVISRCVNAVNYHHPSPVSRSDYAPFTDASRLYVTLKRRKFTQRSPARAWFAFAVGVCHAYLTAIRHDGIGGIARARFTSAQAYRCHRRLCESMASESEPRKPIRPLS